MQATTDTDKLSLEDIENKLGQYKHIFALITKWWNDDEILCLWLAYLLQDTRENQRQGFPEEAVNTLLLLYNQRKQQAQHLTGMDLLRDKVSSYLKG